MDPSSQRHTGPFIAGIGLTHLSVYEQSPAPDGLSSGCAHVHALTDEAYYVVAGEGEQAEASTAPGPAGAAAKPAE